jgi:hypothetical protein
MSNDEVTHNMPLWWWVPLVIVRQDCW